MTRYARVALIGIVAVGLGLSLDGLTSFLHFPSFLLTVGGTVLVTFVSFPAEQLRALLAAIRQAISGPEPLRLEIEETKALARRYRADGIPGLDGAPEAVSNPFLRRGLELVLEWKPLDELRARLEAEHLHTATRYEDSRRILLTIGKLLPASGLIGTLISLVLLLRHPDALTTAHVGPALSLALLSTLYGAVLANAIVLPLEAKLQTLVDHLRMRFEIGLRATQLIMDQAYPSVIEEELACFGASDTDPSQGATAPDLALASAGAR
jgi:chemotaxis protein MotA